MSDDPPAVEAAVTQLEAWGALPAVMFERTRALAALSASEPDLVVLDFGSDPGMAGRVLVRLEELQPILPGAAHGAPVVALAEGAVGPRLERDAWAPVHVAPHDDPVKMRAALLAALGDAVGGGAIGGGGGAGGVGATASAAAGVAMTGRRAAVPAIAAAAAGLLGVGVVAFLVLAQRGPAGELAQGRADGADAPSAAVTPAGAGGPRAERSPALSVSSASSTTAAGSVPVSTAPSVGDATQAPATSAPASSTVAPPVASATPMPAAAVAPTATVAAPTMPPSTGLAVAPTAATEARAAGAAGAELRSGVTGTATVAPRLPVTGSR